MGSEDDTEHNFNQSLGKTLGQLQETLVAELSNEKFDELLLGLEKQFSEDEKKVAKKASNIEELNIRLMQDELNELQQSKELKIIDVDVDKYPMQFEHVIG